MKRGTAFLIVLVATNVLSCATRSFEGGEPRLQLRAESRVAEIPARVYFQAFVEGGADNEPSLYCPDVIWDFQGAKFRKENDCEPYSPESRIQRAYTTDHVFETEGSYEVSIVLLHRGRAVLKRTVRIRVARTGIRVTG